MEIKVYDKAKWHYEGDFPKELPKEQAFVHTGFFLGWIIEQKMCSESFRKDFGELIAKFLEQGISAPKLFQLIDGVLTSDELNEEGNQFAMVYLNFQFGNFLNDYSHVFQNEMQECEQRLGIGNGVYCVQDTWENYRKIRDVINHRYQEWKNTKPECA